MSDSQTYPCNGVIDGIPCQNRVVARRRSKTGTHWCQRRECLNAKQRYYYSLRSSKAARDEAAAKGQTMKESAWIEFFQAALYGERMLCGWCRLPNAIPGWAHRRVSGGPACVKLGNRGPELASLAPLDLVWPEREHPNIPDPYTGEVFADPDRPAPVSESTPTLPPAEEPEPWVDPFAIDTSGWAEPGLASTSVRPAPKPEVDPNDLPSEEDEQTIADRAEAMEMIQGRILAGLPPF